jgi:hypothetical protein
LLLAIDDRVYFELHWMEELKKEDSKISENFAGRNDQ